MKILQYKYIRIFLFLLWLLCLKLENVSETLGITLYIDINWYINQFERVAKCSLLNQSTMIPFWLTLAAKFLPSKELYCQFNFNAVIFMLRLLYKTKHLKASFHWTIKRKNIWTLFPCKLKNSWQNNTLAIYVFLEQCQFFAASGMRRERKIPAHF